MGVTTEEVDRLEAERLRPVPRPGDPVPPDREPAWLPDLRRLIAALADLMLTEDKA